MAGAARGHPPTPRATRSTPMPSRLATAFFAAALALTAVVAQDKPATLGGFDRKDPKFDELIPKDAKIEVLAGGFKWTEGPVWVKDGGHLLFSDIPNNVVNKWSPKDGLKEFLKPSGYTGKAKFERGRARLQRPGHRQVRQPHPLPARRPPRRPADQGRQVRDARRQVHGQAVQQPQRPRLPPQRRPVLHRPALRPAEVGQGPGQGTRLPGRLPAQARRRADAAHQGDEPARTASACRRTRRRCTSPTPTRTRRSGWRSR